MASLVRLSQLNAKKICRLAPGLVIATRKCGFIKDWKPGPPPQTQEEIERAARKYNLIPEDYKQFPPSEGWGDYPDLPMVSQDSRDPYEDMDYYYRRRNYAETLHAEYDIMTGDRHDPNEVTRFTPLQMLSRLLATIFGWFALCLTLHFLDIRTCHAVKPKQWPGPGKVHYTFEPAFD